MIASPLSMFIRRLLNHQLLTKQMCATHDPGRHSLRPESTKRHNQHQNVLTVRQVFRDMS